MNTLRISLVQSPIYWEQKEENLRHFGEILDKLKDKTDLAVLPETFTTGFSMNVSQLAETNDGATVRFLQSKAKELGFAICGSFVAKEGQALYNRGFFITPEGDKYFCDKRHLFRMGGEHDTYTPGDKRLTVSYKGWNIRLAICYDLRFPVWLRNTENEYDLLVITSNWPKVRNSVWEALSIARAMENICYVCAVNRVGEDGNGLPHCGNSLLIDYKGQIVEQMEQDREYVVTRAIEKSGLESFRNKFPAWKDADRFELK